jgi:hypothetical protein
MTGSRGRHLRSVPICRRYQRPVREEARSEREMRTCMGRDGPRQEVIALWTTPSYRVARLQDLCTQSEC